MLTLYVYSTYSFGMYSTTYGISGMVTTTPPSKRFIVFGKLIYPLGSINCRVFGMVFCLGGRAGGIFL